MYTLIGTAKLNNVDPQAWFADVLGRFAGTPQSRLGQLLPWNWRDARRHDQVASPDTSDPGVLAGLSGPSSGPTHPAAYAGCSR